ncbi:Sec7 domain-containing protein [Legionella tunisiensis]|uniref:Sec7 domain-containing protein n=1 Tax=Legionella tunisiensis TaxID=1034944 RepID=UPI0002E64301|nr:Sec7 domain-containing protein [Legionella tunisiensis]
MTQAQPKPAEMKKELQSRQRELVDAFNAKASDGIQTIKNICKAHHITGLNDVGEQIAAFFHEQHRNLDLEAVGDYLSGPDGEHQAVLKAFTATIALAGQPFLPALRIYLKTFLLPKESQKIERLLESFSAAYCAQNPGGNIATKQAGYILTVQAMMQATVFHNPNAAQFKMDFDID